ncbi:uncharacterized protein PAF06_004014 [Gastrophryne carolinensis]
MLYLLVPADAKTCSDCNSTDSANCDQYQKPDYVVCSCKAGFMGTGVNCTRITYCDRYTCCPDGYTWDTVKKQCADINECTNPVLNKCSPNEPCINRNGIHLCTASRSAACSSGPCSSDMDCLKIQGVTRCADPCLNYNTLNGSKRLSNMSSSGRFQTDRYNFGWFRYVGAGVKLQEGCVGPLKCGSLEPFTLEGPHPTEQEGIKMMVQLINTVSGSCSRGTTIPVKACPGGFYVYKFSGSLRYDVYCTEPSQVTATTTPTTTTPTTTTPTTTTATTTTPTTTTPTTTTPTTTTATTTTPTTTTPTTTTPTTTTATTTTPTTTTPTTTTATTTTATTTTPTTTTPTTTTATTTTPTTTTPTTTTATTTTPTTTTPTTTTPTTTTATTTTPTTTTPTTTTATTTTPTTTTATTTTATTTTPTTTTLTTTTATTTTATTTSPTTTTATTTTPTTTTATTTTTTSGSTTTAVFTSCKYVRPFRVGSSDPW